MAVKEVTVTVAPKGITVSPTDITLTRGKDVVKWVGDAEFEIVFKRESCPFANSTLSHTMATRASGCAPQKSGAFKYSVVSGDQELDPVIIIEEPKTTPNP